MKSHTDLEQSKKLLEILPLESADMMWCFDDIKEEPFIFPYRTNIYEDSKDIPAWSLDALLNIINTNYYTTLYHDGVAWNIDIIHHDNVKKKHSVYDNTPIDACVAMIEKLHELKFL